VAGPNTIQRFPRALLDWLGMKAAGGATPANLRPELTSIIDTGELYLLDRLFTVAGVCPVVGLNNYRQASPTNGETTVPNGYTWLITEASVYCNLIPAASTAEVNIGIYNPVGATFLAFFNTPYLATGAAVASSPVVGVKFDRPHVMISGEQVVAWITKSVGAGWNPIIQVRGYAIQS